MEPVTTIEGYNVIQSPDKSRSMLGAYYESLGFRVIKLPETKPVEKKSVNTSAQPAENH
jgi:hypothetical protein